jgi:hypothetical protein
MPDNSTAKYRRGSFDMAIHNTSNRRVKSWQFKERPSPAQMLPWFGGVDELGATTLTS